MNESEAVVIPRVSRVRTGYSVAVVCPFIDDGALLGIEREIVHLTGGLNQRGWQVEIITTDRAWGGGHAAGSPKELPSDVRLTRLEGRLAAHLRGVQPSGAPMIVPGLRGAVARHDVVIVFNAGWPITLRLSGLPGRCPPVLYRTYWHPPRGRSRLLDRVRGLAAASIFARCHTLLAPTTVEADLLRHLLPPGARVTVVPPGTETPHAEDLKARGEVRGALGLDEHTIAIIQIGTPGIFKGTRTAFDAVARLRDLSVDAVLLLVGGNGDAHLVSQMVKSHHAEDWARVLGPVTDREKTRLLAASDALVMLSEYEAFGFVALEALAHGVVPVLFDDFPSSPLLAQSGAVCVPRVGGYLAVAEGVLRAVHSKTRGNVRNWDAFVADVERELLVAIDSPREPSAASGAADV